MTSKKTDDAINKAAETIKARNEGNASNAQVDRAIKEAAEKTARDLDK